MNALKQIPFLLRGKWRSFTAWLAFAVAGIALLYLVATLGREDARALVTAALLFLSLLALFLLARSPVTLIKTKAPEPQPVTTISPQLVVNEVRTAALVSFGQVGQVQVRKERKKPTGDFKEVLGPLVGEELVMDVGVRVVAGVNLKHLREDDVSVSPDGRSLSITLPPTKVMMVYVDESLTQVVSHKTGWFTRRDISMLDAARREAMESMVNAAIEKGLLDKAGEQAATTVRGIASSLGIEKVSVQYTLPPHGAHFEELQDPEVISKLRALPSPPPQTPYVSGE